jgi:RNA polymerase sigma-70 factor (ECF subfamily)
VSHSGFDLSPFCNYLRVLARAGLDPRLRNVVDPSDVVQQTLLEAQESMPRFAGGSFAEQAAWLRQILSRNLADVARDLRRKKRDIERQRSLEQALAQSSMRLVSWLAAETSTPSAKVLREERVLELADAVASLPEDQYETVVLRHCMGWSLEEIARHTSRTDAAVAGLLRKGLKALRGKLSSTP